jgi:hypothetical protein
MKRVRRYNYYIIIDFYEYTTQYFLWFKNDKANANAYYNYILLTFTLVSSY